MKRKLTSSALCALLVFASISQMACGTSSIENALAKGAAALRAAREITTTQHKFGHLDDNGYRARLNFFKNVNTSVDAIGDAIVEAGTITADNQKPILDKINALLGVIDAEIASGDLGVKNADKQADFRSKLLIIRTVVVGIQAAITIVKKPTPVQALKVKV